MKTLLFIIGTRPEAIKLFSVIHASQSNPHFQTKVCVTHQHTDLLTPFLKEFHIDIDFELKQTFSNESLSKKGGRMLEGFEKIMEQCNPHLVVVQGDTLSSFFGALAAHYLKVPVAHVEAGLRTDQLFSPWPEEAHRRMIDQLSSYFFVPTLQAKNALIKEGHSEEKIFTVGNTSIDALAYYRKNKTQKKKNLSPSIVVTMHRRENQGKPLENVCSALRLLGKSFPQVEISFFVHPNPAVKMTVEQALKGFENIKLLAPSDHFSFMEFLQSASFILTDSGGIQEEAPYFGVPVLVARNTTERPEGIAAETARLVGTCPDQIFYHCSELLTNERLRQSMSRVHHPYGKGDSGKRIIQTLMESL